MFLRIGVPNLITIVRHYLKMAKHSSKSSLRRIRKTVARLRDFMSMDSYRNRKLALAASRLELPSLVPLDTSTSVSDYLEYRQLVTGAATDEKIFTLFRSHHQYFPILEHVSKDLGSKYLEIVRRRSNLPVDWVERCFSLNTIGSPQKFSYPSIGRFSPTLLRYAKVFSDLEWLFGPLKGLRCIEIGIGFGGQAAILDFLGEVREIHLYDLPPVLQLAKKFLDRSETSASTLFLDGRDPIVAGPADLLISNYAFSELTRAVQLTYLENAIARASRGYITWNSLSPDGLGPEELLSMIPGSKLLEELPKTAPGNVIIVWGTDRSLSD